MKITESELKIVEEESCRASAEDDIKNSKDKEKDITDVLKDQGKD